MVGNSKEGSLPFLRGGLAFRTHFLSSETGSSFECSDSPSHGGGGVHRLDFDNPPEAVLAFWQEQRARLARLARDAAPAQEAWFASVPPDLAGAQCRFSSVAFRQLLSHFGLGGDKWISQFIFGFPTTGSFSQEGVPPIIGQTPGARSLRYLLFWKFQSKRFRERARASGSRRSQELWGEAMGQVAGRAPSFS